MTQAKGKDNTNQRERPTITQRKMLDLQHQYNNPSHEGGSHILGPTLM